MIHKMLSGIAKIPSIPSIRFAMDLKARIPIFVSITSVGLVVSPRIKNTIETTNHNQITIGRLKVANHHSLLDDVLVGIDSIKI